MAATAKKADPALWEQVKRAVTRGSKGGRPGQWSARKAQMAVLEYKKRGGTYVGKKPRTHLDQWQEEEWGTRSGRRSRDTGERYLPKQARGALTAEEYARTSEKKRRDTRKGRQFSPQPDKIARKTARYRGGATRGESTRAALYAEAKRRRIPGRSRMTKAQLERALAR